MEKPHRLRIKHDLLGIDAELRSTRPLSERDVFDVLKKQDPNLPGQLLKKYRFHREKKYPDQELLSRYETAGLKAMENGFFETEGSFTEGFTEGAKMIAKGARRVPISKNLSANLRAISDNDLGGDPMKYAGDQWKDAVEKSAQQLYGLAQTDKALELGLPIASQVRDLHPIARMGTSVAQYFSDFDKNMDKALAFGGLPNDPSAKRIVMNRVLELDERKSDATTGQAAMEAWGGLALLGEAGLKLIKKNPINPLDIGIKTAIVKATGDNLKNFDRRAELDYLANQDHIIRGMEEGAEIAAQVGKATGVLEPAFGGAETLTDIKTGAVQPDRDQAMAMSLVMSPDVPLTLGASGGLSVARNTVARGMIIGLSRKATLENSAKTALAQFKSIPKPNAVQKQLIARAEKVLRENAGAQQKLNQVVNKNKAIGQRIGIEQGMTRSGNYTQLGQRVQEALARTTGPEASITRRVTGKALEKAGISTETLGKALELMHRVPDEFLARLLINSGFQPENVPSVLKTLRIAGAGAIGYSAELDPNAAEALGLILLTPGGYKLLTRAGSDMAILGRQLQYAKASSPLFQRLAQMDPANPSLSEVTIDRTAALTVPEAVSDVTSQVLSPGRNFGISPMLKGPSTFLTRTGLGNTLESAASTAKTATYASTFPLAFGYAVGGEEGAGMGLGASLFPLTIGMGVGHFAQVNSKFDLAQKLAGDEVIYKDSLDATSKPIFESMPKQVRQAIATGQMQNPDVIIEFKKGRGNSSYQVVDGDSQITIYEKSNPAEIMQAVMGHEIAHHIDKFGYSTLIQEQLLGSVEKNKPGIFTEFDKDGKPIIITDPDGTKVYKTNKEFNGHRQVYLDKLEASGYGPGTQEYAYYKDSNSEIAREIFASHGAAEFFGGKFVKANYEGAGSKLVRSLARPIFNSNGMRNFFHRIGLASNERGLVADPTKLMPGLKEIPELTDMIRKYNSEMRGLDSEGRRAWAQRSGNLVDKDFADEFASAKLTAKDLENPAIVERLKAGGHVKIEVLQDGTAEIATDASGRPVFLPTREVNKRNKNLSNDILDILRKKQGQLKEGHVELETTATGAERASGGFLGADIIAALKKQNRYNPHQLDALGAISRSIEAGGGDAWDLFYYSALKWNKAGRKVYGQIKGGDRLSIPFGIEISKDGNILINTISVDQFRNNLKYFATSNKFKQKFAQAFNAANEYEATRAAFRALPLYLENQRNNVPNDGTNGVTVAQRDFINAALGSVNQEQVVKNPILDAMGKNKRNRSVAIRSRRLDRIGQATQSPRSFGKYDPNKVSQNLMPQMELDFSPPKAAQSLEAKPNFWKIYRIDPKGPKVYDEVADVLIQVGSPWMDGSIAESQAGKLRLDQNKLLQAMNRAHRRADRGGGKQFMPAAYHGTPHTFKAEEGAPLGKFKTSQIGTGEGAQAYGHGLYFAGKREVAEWYRDNLSPGVLDDAAFAKAFLEKIQKRGKGRSEAIAEAKKQNLPEIAEILRQRKEKDYKGSLYKVELAPKENEYLLWDKPLSEQPKGVREKMKKLLTELEGEDLWKYRKDQDYRDITNNALEHMSEPDISAALKEAGIPGIKYLDGSSRNQATFKITPPSQTVSGKYMVKGDDYNSKGKHFDTKAEAEKYLQEQLDKFDYNYVIFDEADVQITDKLFMPQMDLDLVYKDGGRQIIAPPAEGTKRLYNAGLRKLDPKGYLEPHVSDWVKEVAEGAGDVPVSEITKDLIYMSDDPRKWISMIVARGLGKVLQDVTMKDIRDHGRMNVLDIDLSEPVYKVGDYFDTQKVTDLDGNPLEFYKTELYDEGDIYTGEGKSTEMPVGPEPDDFISASSMEITQSLTGDDLVNFLHQEQMGKEGDKLFMPASKAGAPKGKLAEAAKLWNERGTDSPYFKTWFGKSKVVDEKGEPLVVYHGTDKEFTAFDPEAKSRSSHPSSKLGFFFGEYPEQANLFNRAQTDEPFPYRPNLPASKGAKTLKTFLQIKKPKEYSFTEWRDLMADETQSNYLRTTEGYANLKKSLEGQGYDGIIVRDNSQNYYRGSGLEEYNGRQFVAFKPEQIKSATGNRGTFDAGEGNILFMPSPGDTTPSSVQSWDGPNPTFATKLTKGMAKDNKEIAALLREVYEETFGEPLKAKDFSDTEVTWLADMLATEGEAALGRTGNAVDWYTSAVERALSVAEEIFPDIGKKFEARDRFLGALSITSQNMKVLDNAKASVMQYEHKLRTGKFNYKVKHGEKGKAITKNLRMYDEIEAKMGIDAFHKFLDRDFTVKTLSEWGKKFFNNKKFSIAGYQTDKVKGSAVFGPKIGQGFFQNLRGNYDPVTVDLWLRRTYGRLTGLALDTALTPKDIGRIIYSVRKNVGKRKFAGLELPDFLQGVRITGNLQKDGKANFRISDKSFESLFGDNTIGRDNTETIFEFAEKLNREWERNFAKAGNDVKKAKEAIRKAKKAGKGVVNLEKKLAKLEVEKEAIGNEKPQWAKAGSTITDKLKPIDVPSNAERAVITKAFNEALEQLRAKGINLTPADLQATLWYPEKDIWAYLKGRDSNALNMSYDTAMEMIRDQRK